MDSACDTVTIPAAEYQQFLKWKEDTQKRKENHKEYMKEYMKEYREQNKEKYNAKKREWYHRQKGKVQEAS